MKSGEGVRNYYRRQGYSAAIEQTVKLIESRQCFDFRANSTCDHAACFALFDLAALLVKGTN